MTIKSNELIGKKYGRLTILKYISPRKQNNKYIRTHVICSCDCGSSAKEYLLNNLRRGLTQSCGCLVGENSSLMGKIFGHLGGESNRKFPPKLSNAIDLYKKYMARNPGNLEIEDFLYLTQLPCSYCNCPPNQSYYRSAPTPNALGKKEENLFIYNGLDRKDNSRGYDKDNVIACCKVCNYMRHDLSIEDFYTQIIKILNHKSEEFRKFGLEISVK